MLALLEVYAIWIGLVAVVMLVFTRKEDDLILDRGWEGGPGTTFGALALLGVPAVYFLYIY